MLLIVSDMKPMNAVSILRVSTKKQLDGEGIETQRQGNDLYCEQKGYKVIREFELAESASDGKKRTSFEDVLDYCVAHEMKIAAVVIWRVDRFSRAGLHDYYQLKAFLAQHGIRLESATENIDGSASGEVMEGMLAIIARYENRTRVARTIGAERIMTKEGYWCRAAPTGFVNGHVYAGYSEKGRAAKRPVLLPTPDKEQWDLLCYGLRKQMSGAYKPFEVAEELRKKGFKVREMVRNGKRSSSPLSQQTWYKICRSPAYGGLLCEKWTDNEYVRAKFDGALTPDEWYELQRVLDGNTKKPVKLPRNRQHPDFPLRRFLCCTKCGAPVTGSPSRGKSGKIYRYYDCSSGCCGFRVRVEDAHALFLQKLRQVTPSEKVLQSFKELVLGYWENKWDSLREERLEHNEKALELDRERSKLLSLIKASSDSPSLLESLQKEYERVNKQHTAATMKRNTTEVEECDAATVVGYCSYFLRNVCELWDKASVQDKYRYQSLIFPNGVRTSSLEDKRTPEMSLVYQAISQLDTNENALAAPRGIEPRFSG